MNARIRALLDPQVLPWLCGLLLVAWIGGQSFQGRVQLRSASVNGCQRSALDRAGNARAWRAAERARRADHDWGTAALYGQVAGDLEQRARIDCHAAYPHPNLSPFGVLAAAAP